MKFLALLGMTFQFWWVKEEGRSGAPCAPLRPSSQITAHNVIPNARLTDARLIRQSGGQAVGQGVKRNEESLLIHEKIQYSEWQAYQTVSNSL